MDECEDAGGGVGADYDAGMSYDFMLVASSEEDEVAGLQVPCVAHLGAQFGLCTAPTRQVVSEVAV